MSRWTHYVAIDWSGAKGARQPGIAVAICTPGRAAPTLVRPGHRWSREDVLRWLLDEMPAGTLAGFDASPAFAYADRGAYFPGWVESPPDARALWAMIARMCADVPHMGASAFVDHAEASRHFRRDGGREGDLFEAGRGRLRETERRQKDQHLSPSSCFNLVGAAQVGKSSLTMMRVLNRIEGRIPVWPFDEARGDGSLLVEIYTSIAALAAKRPKGQTKVRDRNDLDVALNELSSDRHAPLTSYDDHATDAIMTAAWLRTVCEDAALWHPPALTPEIARTEGWTFGVA